jgi:hypothetical protein
MQAIRTKFYGPTNTRGSRIQAKAEAGAIFMNWDYALGVDGNHRAACELLRAKLGWTRYEGSSYTPMVGGEFDGAHYWVFTNVFTNTDRNGCSPQTSAK